MKKEKVIAIVEHGEKDVKDIKEILKEIVEENIRIYLSKESFHSD